MSWTILETYKGTRQCLARCDCGVTKLVSKYDIKYKKTTRCMKCYGKERPKGFTHDYKTSSIYRRWVQLRGRCNNPNNNKYIYYGARGIKVCERWGNFENFLMDMGQPPSPKHSIDRINNDGDYEPSNCRWATADVQNNNKRPRFSVTRNGKLINKENHYGR